MTKMYTVDVSFGCTVNTELRRAVKLIYIEKIKMFDN